MSIAAFFHHLITNRDFAFNHLFGVVPCSTSVRLKDCQQNTADSHPGQQTAQHSRITKEAGQNRSNDGKESWQNHFSE